MQSTFRLINIHLLLGFVRHMVGRFSANQGILNAAALTYTTLFAVVPMMTVTYAMLASVPSFQGLGPQLETMIFDNFVPSTGAAVKDYISGFAGQARNLTGLGIVLLIVTAYLMLRSIERTFNRIWQVREQRQRVASFLLYWAVLSLGPVLLGLGLVLSSYVMSLPLISGASVVVDSREWLLKLLPLLLSCSAFTLLYAAVPNCHVPFRHALAGGCICALLFEGAKHAFAMFVALSPSYHLIYGAFAAVPLFLVWIYISWLIVLLGAEFVRALTCYDFNQRSIDASPFFWGLKILEQLWSEQERGQGLYPSQLSSRLPGLSVMLLSRYLDDLKRADLITCNAKGQYLLCRDIHRLTLEQFSQKVAWQLPGRLDLVESETQTAWVGLLEKRLDAVQRSRSDQLQSSLAQLFSEPSSEAGDPDRSSGSVVRLSPAEPPKQRS
ncbi:MAG: YihY family inner membrane protein [Motiliproteus sp.]